MARKYHSIHAKSAFCIFAVFYTQSAVGKPHLLRSPRFVSEVVFYIQSVTRFITHDQSVFCDEEYRGRNRHNVDCFLRKCTSSGTV